jgi:hypothetical protein
VQRRHTHKGQAEFNYPRAATTKQHWLLDRSIQMPGKIPAGQHMDIWQNVHVLL